MVTSYGMDLQCPACMHKAFGFVCLTLSVSLTACLPVCLFICLLVQKTFNQHIHRVKHSSNVEVKILSMCLSDGDHKYSILGISAFPI